MTRVRPRYTSSTNAERYADARTIIERVFGAYQWPHVGPVLAA
jgi:hypothetical protein